MSAWGWMRSGPPSTASETTWASPGSAASENNLDPWGEAYGLAVELARAEHEAEWYRDRVWRVFAQGALRELILRLLLHWRLACPRGRWV